MIKSLFVFAVLIGPVGALAQSTGAPQVGYPSSRSPFSDLDYRQELTVFGGQLLARTDPAGVAPQSGAMLGGRYEIAVGGPAQLYARASRVFSQRLAIDPAKPAASRSLGIVKIPLYLADVGLSVNLTGQRSFHKMVPSVAIGVGTASTLRSKVENDPYQFGTTFAFSFGGGLRFVPGDRVQLRLDGGTHMYQIRYPAQYYTAETNQTAFLPAAQSKSFWKSNPSITAGISYLFFR